MSSQDSAQLRKARRAGDAVRPLHSKKTAPRDGEWLAEHRESGQTLAEYVRSGPNRPTAGRTTIYVQPLGEFSPGQQRIVAATTDYLERLYQIPVKVLPAASLEDTPAYALRTHPTWGDRQLLTSYVLDDLLPERLPRDAVALLALTAIDLWPGEGWNFVFGQASLKNRVGVWSMHRNGDADGAPDEQQFCLTRTIKTASHELGHMLGIKHCTAYECAMNGSNHQAESDSRPLAFCPECSGKVWWACRADPRKQTAALLEFAEQHNLPQAAEFWRKTLEALPR